MKTSKTLGFLALLGFITPVYSDTLVVDKDKSRIQVDAKATGHRFTGTLSDYKVSIEGEKGSLQPTAVALSWKFSDLKTGDDARDAEMIKWLGSSPEGTFKFTKFWTGEGGKSCAMGDLTIHGVTKSVGFTYTAEKEGNWVTIEGSVPLNYEDFGLPLIKKLVMKVDPGLTVRFHLVGESK